MSTCEETPVEVGKHAGGNCHQNIIDAGEPSAKMAWPDPVASHSSSHIDHCFCAVEYCDSVRLMEKLYTGWGLDGHAHAHSRQWRVARVTKETSN